MKSRPSDQRTVRSLTLASTATGLLLVALGIPEGGCGGDTVGRDWTDRRNWGVGMGASGGEGGEGGEGGAGGGGGEGGEGTCNGTCTYECEEEDLCASEAEALAEAKEAVSAKEAEIDALGETIAFYQAVADQWDATYDTLVGEVGKMLSLMSAANGLSPDSKACLSQLSDVDPKQVLLEMGSGLPGGAEALLAYEWAKDDGLNNGNVGHYAVRKLKHAAVESVDEFVEGLNGSPCKKFEQGASKSVVHKTFSKIKVSCAAVGAAAIAVYTWAKYEILLSECEAAFGEFMSTEAALNALQGRLNALTAAKAAAKDARDAALETKAEKEADKAAAEAELETLKDDEEAAQEDLDECEEQMDEEETPSCAVDPDGGTCSAE